MPIRWQGGGWPKDIRITAGSTSVRAFEQPLREAAAVARAMLVGAAADRWNIEPSECDTADGFVINGVRTFAFGELAEEAADRSPPQQPGAARNRQAAADRAAAAAARRAGQDRRKLRFAGDVRLPGHAVRVGPAGPARRAADRLFARCGEGSRASAMSPRAIVVGGRRRQLVGGRARAQGRRPKIHRARERRRTVGRCSTTRWRSGDAHEWFSRGDYDSTVRGSRPLAATYYVAPSQHLGLEPVTATRALSVANGSKSGRRPRRPGSASAGRTCDALSDAGRRAGRAGARSRRRRRSRSNWRARPAAGPGLAVASGEPEPRPRRRPARWRK